MLSTNGGNVIEGNYIGTNVTGTNDRGNWGYGIRIVSGDNNRIGGTTPMARNVISGNKVYGIYVGSGTGNVITGNNISTNTSGTAKLGNDTGVSIYATNTTFTVGAQRFS